MPTNQAVLHKFLTDARHSLIWSIQQHGDISHDDAAAKADEIINTVAPADDAKQ